MINRPTVSVVIPNYNRADLVVDTIDSMLAQTYNEMEIIVVDDGSTDRSLDVLRTYGEKILVIQQENAGPGAARNTGLRHSTGEFVQFMDSDDLTLSNKLETQVGALIKTGADIAIGPWVKTAITGKSLRFLSGVYQAKGIPDASRLGRHLASDWAIMLQPCMFRRDLAVRVGGIPEHLCSPEDQAFLLKCILAGGKAVFTPESLVLYREGHEGKLTGTGMTAAKRQVEWARYLIWQRGQFLTHQNPQDPAKWPGYRNRLQESLFELESIGECELANELAHLHRLGHRPFESARITKSIARVRRCLNRILSGYSEAHPFHMGSLSPIHEKRLRDQNFIISST